MNKWHVNVTFIDTETHIEGKLKSNFSDHICSDPFEVLNSLKAGEGVTRPNVTLYDFMSKFFAKIAGAIKRLGKRLQIEVIHGDIIGVCEAIQFGLYRTDDELLKRTGKFGLRPKEFPDLCDRIHMSNCPYVSH